MKHIVLLLLSFILLVGCRSNREEAAEEEVYISKDLSQLTEAGEIIAVTLDSAAVGLAYRKKEAAQEYKLIEDFAKSRGLRLTITTAESTARLTEMLQAGEADIVVYPLIISSRLREEVLFCGRERLSVQVLVQRAEAEDTVLKNVAQLIGKEVYVLPDSHYALRMKHLDEELGGGILIRHVEGDSLTVDDLIGQVSSGEIAYTVSDDHTARANKELRRNIHIGLPVGLAQRSAWAVRKGSPLLATAINDRMAENERIAKEKKEQEKEKKVSAKRRGQSRKTAALAFPKVPNGHLSPYDSLFKKYAVQLGWDWRLLAAVSWKESNFRAEAYNRSGATGLMGITISTGRVHGVAPNDLKDPEINIRTSVKCLLRFGQSFTRTADPEERIKLMLASYNAGVGHIVDAQRLAGKYGKDPDVWEDNVTYGIRLKGEARYYNDPVCKYGYLHGTQVLSFVREVLAQYEYYLSLSSTKTSPTGG
ncbi:Membrane-bound lytic murein transglycosylase F precursor [Bacteroidales bacterium Barb6XT]|nr:Membrane-bound lytic murein transglycosylase F precursor [Bacteroidales bacterium Barb6XT]